MRSVCMGMYLGRQKVVVYSNYNHETKFDKLCEFPAVVSFSDDGIILTGVEAVQYKNDHPDAPLWPLIDILMDNKSMEYNDVMLHNAIEHIEDNSVGSNIIIEELQKGYYYNGKVFRYSNVKVAN